MDKYILDFIYLMPWNLSATLSFMKFYKQQNEEIEKTEKYGQKPLELCANLCGGLVAYYCALMYKWCLVYVCVKIHTHLLILYNDSITDIEHTSNYIALGSSQTH